MADDGYCPEGFEVCLAAAAASRAEWEQRVDGKSVAVRVPQGQQCLQEREAFVNDMRRRGQVPPGYR